MKIIIAGGRDYVPQRKHLKKLFDILRELNETEYISEFVSGACDSGADIVGELSSMVFDRCSVKRFPADWNKNGKAACSIRNEQMAKYVGNNGGCILLPGGKGTDNMKMNAIKYGLKIWEIK